MGKHCREHALAYLKVRVTPAARQDALAGWQADVLRMRVRAAPERGDANRAACRLVADHLGLPLGHVILAKGEASRDKLLYIEGLSEEEVRQRLAL